MSKIIKIVPYEENAEAFINIKPSSDFIPEWYRKSPSTILQTSSEISLSNVRATNGTYKKCSPFYDAMTSGYTIFLTADIEVVKKPDGSPFIGNRTERYIVTDHHPLQWNGLPVPMGYTPYVFKWHNQFEFSTPKDYSMLFTHPINRFDLPFQTITGIVDTDKFVLPVHFPFFIRSDFTGIIEKNTPLAQMIPIKRDLWSRELQDYDKNKSTIKYDTFLSTIKRSYKNNFWARKEYK